MTSYDHLPDDLPIPVDDGAAEHLIGSRAPAVGLTATTLTHDAGQDTARKPLNSDAEIRHGEIVRLDQISGRTVLFAYPRTGTPGQPSPTGWDAIPGARGCTPQACAIRDSYAEFSELGARVFGLSSQFPADQLEAAQRLALPYPLLSDSDLTLARAWQLPTFSVDGLTLIRRITIFVMNGVVDGVIYPVFPPDRSAAAALAWLRERKQPAVGSKRRIVPRRGLPHPIPPRLVR